MKKDHPHSEDIFLNSFSHLLSGKLHCFTKTKKMTIILLSLLLLTACASISDIVPAGPDTYLVSGSNLSVGASGAQIKTDLYKKASDFCTAKDQNFEPVDSSYVDYRVFRGTANAELTFRCIPK